MPEGVKVQRLMIPGGGQKSRSEDEDLKIKRGNSSGQIDRESHLQNTERYKLFKMQKCCVELEDENRKRLFLPLG